ncbi:hypothetical protein U1Q18_052339 [Sarracenia purpurea var. burkii]
MSGCRACGFLLTVAQVREEKRKGNDGWRRSLKENGHSPKVAIWREMLKIPRPIPLPLPPRVLCSPINASSCQELLPRWTVPTLLSCLMGSTDWLLLDEDATCAGKGMIEGIVCFAEVYSVSLAGLWRWCEGSRTSSSILAERSCLTYFAGCCELMWSLRDSLL